MNRLQLLIIMTFWQWVVRKLEKIVNPDWGLFKESSVLTVCRTGGELSSVGLVGRGCSLSWWGGSCVEHWAKSSAFLPPRLTFSTPTCHPHAEKSCSRPTLAAMGWGCSEGAVGGCCNQCNREMRKDFSVDQLSVNFVSEEFVSGENVKFKWIPIVYKNMYVNNIQ